MNLIDIIKIDYGFNNKQAKNYIKTLNDKTKNAILENFRNNAKLTFYND